MIVSGTYLFLAVLAATVQPVWGSPLPVSMADLRDFFLTVWISIPFAVIIGKNRKAKQKGKELIRVSALFWMLMISVVLGFLLNAGERIFNLEEYGTFLFVAKLISSCGSILLLSLAYVFSKRKAGLVLLILEWIFWTLKALVYYKASPDLIVSGYFTVLCWSLRLVLIMKLVLKSKTPASVSA